MMEGAASGATAAGRGRAVWGERSEVSGPADQDDEAVP